MCDCCSIKGPCARVNSNVPIGQSSQSGRGVHGGGEEWPPLLTCKRCGEKFEGIKQPCNDCANYLEETEGRWQVGTQQEAA